MTFTRQVPDDRPRGLVVVVGAERDPHPADTTSTLSGVLVLLPPSEGKAASGRGRPVDLGSLSLPVLRAPTTGSSAVSTAPGVSSAAAARSRSTRLR